VPESGTKGVHPRECTRKHLRLQLTRHREVRRHPKELVVLCFQWLFALRVLVDVGYASPQTMYASLAYRFCDHSKLLSCTLAITTTDERCVDFDKIFLLIQRLVHPRSMSPTLKKPRIAVDASSRMRITAPRVFVRGLRCAMSLRNSIV
jgi:hypothetical protein